MKTRVQITLDSEVHRAAKPTAMTKQMTLSALIESLLLADSASQKMDLLSEMTGSATLRNPKAGSDALYASLSAKYIR